MFRLRIRIFIGLLFASFISSTLAAEETQTAFSTLKVPEGFTVEVAATAPLVQRPIVAAFDDDGHLYVAESSGSNDKVEKQFADKPHRIVRLDDTDGDGKFDRRTVFAEHLMFPEGTMFFDGSLYVAAVPSIWKFTDRDGDGVADERVEWFQGKTMTGCANDLHGPYPGPDGWFYWCKGAFAEQTHMVNGHEWTTKAAHIFRCRPDGSGFEPVFTAGMDNPVDISFMPDGERIVCGTYFNGDPRHDGIAHAVYGGVWGKQHNVIDGHPRTGELMPIIVTYYSAAACSGFERYDSDAFGPEYRDNLFLCQFNLRKVTRHILKPSGSTYESENSDLVSSDFVDFHPTDVVVDADGSLLVIDTGGWYKLCCPTSQLWKPDILGGIYRVRRTGAKLPHDPPGREIKWSDRPPTQLWNDLADARPAVRKRATRELARHHDAPAIKKFIDELSKGTAAAAITTSAVSGTSASAVDRCDAKTAAMARAWALVQISSDATRQLLRHLLTNEDEQIRHIAIYAASLNRDAAAAPEVLRLLQTDSPANCRIAAETLGRIGERRAVPQLLAAAAKADERILQHSVIYALIELADVAATRKGLADSNPKTAAAALIALDQMAGGDLKAADVIPYMNASDETLRNAALWIVMHRTEWGSELSDWVRGQLKSLPPKTEDTAATTTPTSLETLIRTFAGNAAIQNLLAEVASNHDSTAQVRMLALQVMAAAKLREPPACWIDAEAKVISAAETALLPLAIGAARSLPPAALANEPLKKSLLAIAESTKYDTAMRVDALAVISASLPGLSDGQVQLLQQALATENPVPLRSAAAEAISKAHLTPAQLVRLCDAVRTAGPTEMNRLFAPFAESQDEKLGLQLLASLKENPGLSAVRLDLLREALAKYSPVVQEAIKPIEALVNVDAEAQRKQIESLLPLLAKGDIRRGHVAFYSAKAVCSTCHRLGIGGGNIGPDLSHIGQTRTERDLLESILFPSLSFVRSYEPVLITTVEGKTINGVIKDEGPQEYVVATGPDEIVKVARADVDEIQPSKVSIMPAGLDKQLSTQELIDLVVFLKNSTNH